MARVGAFCSHGVVIATTCSQHSCALSYSMLLLCFVYVCACVRITLVYTYDVFSLCPRELVSSLHLTTHSACVRITLYTRMMCFYPASPVCRRSTAILPLQRLDCRDMMTIF